MFRKVTDSKDPHFGFNALTGEFGDLVKDGVLDPTKVVPRRLRRPQEFSGLTEAEITTI